MGKTIKNRNIKNGKIDMPLLILVLMLVALGLVMVLSASAPYSLAETGTNSYSYFKNQIRNALLGLVVMLGLSRLDYKIYKKLKWIIYFFSVGILFTVWIPRIGAGAYGAKRWISIAGISFQPSELTKIGVIIWLAAYLSNPELNKRSFFKSTVVPLVGVLLPIVILYKVQNHLSAGIIIFVSSMVVMFLSNIPAKNLIILMLLFSLAGTGLYFYKEKNQTKTFRSERIEAWLHPEENANGKAYQTLQGLYAIGSGGLIGRGLGESKQKYLYIPAAHNDFIFAILAEELGFVGVLAVISLFLLFGGRGIYISTHSDDMFASLVTMGITTIILFQAILNIAVVTNTIPNTGISLPFLSYGGTSLIILLASIGVILNISRSNQREEV